MKIQTMIMLGADERHILNHLDSALNLVGWRNYDHLRGMSQRDAAELGEESRELFLDIKAISRVRSDQFAMADVERTESFVRRMANALIDRAPTEQPFSEEYM